jgi:antagonist of KipI
MTLRVLEPGLCTLVVDLGRPSQRSLGVPLGGAADQASLVLGNALVGNAPAAAALEICLHGPTLQAETNLACVVYGAPFLVTRIAAASPGAGERSSEIPPGRTFTLADGDQLHIGPTTLGMRAYLCVRGGLQVSKILRSCSGLKPLEAGTRLPCSAGTINSRSLPAFVPAISNRGEPHADRRYHPSAYLHALFGMPPPVSWPVRIVDGLQVSWFPESDFLDQEMAVTSASNRMGLRLQGRPLTWPGREMLSEPVCPGAVQVTRDGQCIILGVDGQTIGGYPKIAQVIQADLDHLGQLRPNDRVRFVRVGLEEAVELYRQRQAELRGWITRLQASLDVIR